MGLTQSSAAIHLAMSPVAHIASPHQALLYVLSYTEYLPFDKELKQLKNQLDPRNQWGGSVLPLTDMDAHKVYVQTLPPTLRRQVLSNFAAVGIRQFLPRLGIEQQKIVLKILGRHENFKDYRIPKEPKALVRILYDKPAPFKKLTINTRHYQ